MPINEIIEGAVKQVSDAIDSMKPDVAALRRDLADRASESLSAMKDGSRDDPWLTRADADTMAFSPTSADGHPILINGKSTTFWPRAGAEAAIAQFRDAVTRGTFDDQLSSGGQPTVSPKIEGEQRPDDPENGSMTTGGGRTDASEVETRFTEHLGGQTRPSE